MTDLEKVKIYINDSIKDCIEQLKIIYKDSDNEIYNVNIGYLKGLARAIGHIEEVEEELHNTKDISANPYSYEPEEQKESEKYSEYNVGETVLYQNGDRFELGIVKSVCGNDEYFVWYNTGNTAAKTLAKHMHKISNDYAFKITRLDPEGKERK